MTSPEFDERREAVRRTASQLTRESTSVVRLNFRRAIYYVPGRQRYGRRSSKIATALLFLPVAVLMILALIPLGILSEIGIEPRSRRAKRIFVHGEKSCQALPFADAVREARSDVWLAWSNSQVALVATTDRGPQVRWRGTAQERPELQVAKRQLHWPDGSRVEFDLSADKRSRVQAHHGTP